MGYSFSEAVNTADIIFFGKILSKGDSVLRDYGTPEQPLYFCYTEVTAEVIEGVKGVSSGNMVVKTKILFM